MLPALARAASPPNTLGVYAGAGNPASVARFETNVGRPVVTVHDALARENWANLSNPTWFVNQWNASAYRQRVLYSVPMLPDSGGTLAEGAKGAYNGYFRTLAQRFVAAGAGSAVLRIGPEFNGFWFRWSITAANSGASYAAFWRQIVTTMRAVPGANFKFDWCANNGSSWVNGQQLQAESAYPGDAYVDYIGLDVYDQSWGPNHASPAGRWSELYYQRNGLRWHRDFAAAHGKPMTFPEWGLANRADGYGGGDAPYFIEQMYEWIRTNNVAYHMYFEHTDGSGDYALFSGGAPNASLRFVELFGAGSTGGPLVPPAVPGASSLL
ncbi:MAG: glycoside hydrolase family 26 protein [Solirubrobacteraceae bacterium]